MAIMGNNNPTGRRKVLKGISVAGLSSLVFAGGASSATAVSSPESLSSQFTDTDSDQFSGSDPQGSYWYTNYRGFMNSSITRVSMITGSDRVLHEFSTCCSSEYQREHRLNGWDDGYFLGGSAVDIDFPNHQVLIPQDDGDEPNEWIGSNIGGTTDMSDLVGEEGEAAFNLLNSLAPWGNILTFEDFWSTIAAANSEGSDYDFKWGDSPLPTYEDQYRTQHWVKFVVEEMDDDPPVVGTVDHTTLAGSLDDNIQSLYIADSGISSADADMQTADKETTIQKKKLVDSLGLNSDDVESVMVKKSD